MTDGAIVVFGRISPLGTKLRIACSNPSNSHFRDFAGWKVVPRSLRTPIEALVDQVAGELAFFAPLAEPEVARELDGAKHLTLDGVARIRDAVAPEASFSATAHALVRLIKDPLSFVVAEERLKPTEQRSLASDQFQLIEGVPPEAKLRAASVFSNDGARAAGLKLFQNMRIPPQSVISAVYYGETNGAGTRIEDQAEWESSGDHLPHLQIHVEARMFSPVVYALIRLE